MLYNYDLARLDLISLSFLEHLEIYEKAYIIIWSKKKLRNLP